jgi:hypothetical protein
MIFTRLYNNAEGVSCFEEVQVDLLDQGIIGRISELYPVTGVLFRETPADYHFDWHPAPHRQFIILLDGEIEITAGSGEVKRFRGGDILLVEDTEGRGHLTRHVVQQTRRSLFLPVEEEV